MRRALILVAGLLAGCSIDAVVIYSATTTDAYELPDNHIPEAQLERLSIDSTDGVELAAFLATQPDPMGADSVLFLHGQAEHIDAQWETVMGLWDAGFNVMIVDYRGYGMSTGEPSEQGLYDDAAAAHRVLLASAIDPARITIYGFSMGTGVASHLALEAEARRLVLAAPYTSMSALIEGSTPYTLPAHWLTDVELDTLSRMPRIATPAIVAHGLDDPRIPMWMGRAVFEAARNGHAAIFVDDADHQSINRDARDAIIAAIRR